MNSHFYISIFLLAFFISCASSKNASYENLIPSLYLNGEEFNSAIINFDADYGFDRPDGDVLMGEFKIEVTEFSEESQTLQISGNLSGVYINESVEKLGNAPIKLIDDQRNKIKEFRSDSSGNFDIDFNYESGYQLEFNYIGFRTLFIDLSKLTNQTQS